MYNRRAITRDELEVILRKHKLWLVDDPEGERADLTDANLTRADLYGANLYGANLYGANLYGANLYGADLYGANLTRANLTRANLYGADLTDANLTRANLYGANLYGANLTDANLYGANLYGANLTRANLYGANLYGANLTDANLYGANLSESKNANHPLVCPEEGSFIGFKKVRGDYIVKLEIPEDALRSSATSRKCRCSHAKVISITNIDGTPANVECVYSTFDETFAYKVGEIVKVYDFDPDRWHECAPGIHFFITRTEAMNY